MAHADADVVLMARSPMCLELAEAHCLAVDYPKTGVPPRYEKRHVPRVSSNGSSGSSRGGIRAASQRACLLAC